MDKLPQNILVRQGSKKIIQPAACRDDFYFPNTLGAADFACAQYCVFALVFYRPRGLPDWRAHQFNFPCWQ